MLKISEFYNELALECVYLILCEKEKRTDEGKLIPGKCWSTD